jgi:hypothetical protein
VRSANGTLPAGTSAGMNSFDTAGVADRVIELIFADADAPRTRPAGDEAAVPAAAPTVRERLRALVQRLRERLASARKRS